MRSSICRIGFIVVAMSILGVFGPGCDRGKPSPDPPSVEASGVDSAASPPQTPRLRQGGPAASGVDIAASPQQTPRPPPASADYFKDATSVPRMFNAKVGGPVRLLDLVVYPGYVIAQIQDPKKKENVDRYQLRDGTVADGEPVRLLGSGAKKLDQATLDIASVDFAAVPAMVADAVLQLKIEDGKVSHAILSRGLPLKPDVRWRVYVTGARKNGSVEYDTAGHVKKVWN
jgi:hypothetical protein